MNLRVLHAATHQHNIGDGALVAGMNATLEEDLGVHLDVVPIDVLDCKLRKQRNMLPPSTWSDVQSRVDLVLVGGGGMIEGGAGNFLSGINFNFDLSILERSPIPWVFYALGFNQFRNTHFFHRSRLSRLLEIVERRGMLFSVRNDGSKQRLERLLGPLPFVQTVPDPGLWVPTREREVPELASDRPNILVQLSGDRHLSRLGDRARHTWRKLARRDPLDHLARVLEEVVAEHGARLVLCPHLVGDVRMIHELVRRLPQRTVREACTLSSALSGVGAAPSFFELYRRADLVLGMRGHSAICAVGLGVPFIGLATHDKIKGFLDEVGLGDSCVDFDSNPLLGGLRGRIDQVLASTDVTRQRVCAVLPGLREATRKFHCSIARQLGS